MLTLQTKKVSNMTKKGKHTVLFICLGNICRSPAAEGIMKSLVEKAGLQDEFEIDSAGIGGWHIGQLPDSRMRKCGAEHGYNFNSHARQFQKSDFARFETILVMDNENYRAITSMASSESDRKKVVRMADFLTHHREYTTVPDPYYGDYSDFELVITLLEDACQELLDSIIGEGVTTDDDTRRSTRTTGATDLYTVHLTLKGVHHVTGRELFQLVALDG